MTLHLSSTLDVPLDACTQTFAWIGRKGSGKTYGAGKMVEELLDKQVQVVILDTVGNWYGLRLRNDGVKGYEIPVFGGLRQDLPLLSTAGEVVADVVVDSGRSVILDVSQFNFSERKRFAADFGTRLWQRKKGESQPSPLHLVIEECQLIVPQFVGKDETRMVHVYEEIIRLGRNYGIGASMITQRPQSVNKEVLTQAECIMAFQLNGVPERKALKDWLTYEGGDVNLVNELPGLPVGTCYLWSPQWLRTFKKITIAKKWTLDASATPKMGAKVVCRDPAPLDVKDIEARMATTIEKAKADDPKELRRQLAALHRQIEGTLTLPTPELLVKEVPLLPDHTMSQLRSLIEFAGEKIVPLVTTLRSIEEEVSKTCATFKAQPRHDVARRVPTHPSPSMRKDAQVVHRSMNGAEQRILDALAELETLKVIHPERVQVAFLAGYTNLNSKGFTNAIGALRTKGHIDYPTQGSIMLTAAGSEHANYPGQPRTSAEIQERVIRLLGGASERILVPLIDRYPKSIEREELAGLANYTNVNSKGFTNAIGRLRTLGFIDYPERGHVAAQPVLFLE